MLHTFTNALTGSGALFGVAGNSRCFPRPIDLPCQQINLILFIIQIRVFEWGKRAFVLLRGEIPHKTDKLAGFAG
jgi:hypothetical protein